MSQEKSISIQVPEGYQIDTEKSTLTNIVFKLKEAEKSKYPMSHRECFEDDETTYWFNVHGDLCHGEGLAKNITPNELKSKELAEAFLALMQLKTLCDKWNEIDQFIPDWTDREQEKWCIKVDDDKINEDVYCTTSSTLFFKTQEIAKLFLQLYPGLLQTAKPLL